MDPERVRAYLQAACAGLGFDIGEVWWTSSENGSSTVAAIEEPVSDDDENLGSAITSARESKKKLRFVQLYTSKSFENRREELVNPPEQEQIVGIRRSSSSENLQKHVLSPKLVDAISKTAQVVWANTKKQEGLTGRSDIRLQTAVGMPVAMDDDGNMCIVVLFSPNNIPSTDDAVEYLQSISRSATSSSIPCLVPVFDPNTSNMRQLPPSLTGTGQQQLVPQANALGEGVTARFVSFDNVNRASEVASTLESDEIEVHSQRELKTAPKDTFGIPMLPSDADDVYEGSLDIFDEASYGIWATIMDTLKDTEFDINSSSFDNARGSVEVSDETEASDLRVVPLGKVQMSDPRKERLEEFCHAFLGISVFDLSDVWIPESDDYADSLRHVMSVSSATTNEHLYDFSVKSENAEIKMWSGAVGQAYSSGNPVWSANSDDFIDSERAESFRKSNIQTVLAVPVYSGNSASPACVVACYALVRSESVPFVLRFVQQALRLLWEGLDKVEPHESVDRTIWQGLEPADLGEMAADVEMQSHFMTKKRPHEGVESTRRFSIADDATDSLSSQLQSINLPNGDTVAVPMTLVDRAAERTGVNGVEFDYDSLQRHVYDAVRSVQDAVPFDYVHTNASGTKRAHVIGSSGREGYSNMPQPLCMPLPLPTHVLGSSTRQVPTAAYSSEYNDAQHGRHQTQLSQQMHELQNQSSAPQIQHSNVSQPQQQFFSPAELDDLCHFIPLNGMSMTHLPGPSPDLVSSGSPSMTCRIDGCSDLAAPRRPYCERHSSGNRLCEHKGCNKCAQGSTRFCIAHGGGRRCTHPGCDKGARDKFYCAAHGGGKRCKIDGCNKSAVGGSPLCTAHGGGRRCCVDGCDKSAQSSTQFCVKHGGGKKCMQDGCEKVARGRTQYCAAHGGGVRCKLEGCNRVAIGKMQLCRAHGGGSRTKKEQIQSFSPTHSESSAASSLYGPNTGLRMDYTLAST